MSNLDFVIAKIRGMRGKIYEGNALLDLCGVGSIEDLAHKMAPGAPVGDTIGLQRHFTQEHVESLYRIAKYLDDWDREFYLWLLRRHQAENFKVIVRVWATKSMPQALKAYTVPLPEELALPAEEMIQAETMEQLITKMPDQKLREGAFLGLGDYEESNRAFFIEAGIDNAYYTILYQLSKRSPSEGIQRLVELDLAIYNTMFVLRSLFNYGLIFNKVRPFLAPCVNFSPRLIDEMRNAPDIDAAAAAVPGTLTGQAGPMPAEQLELAMWQNMFNVANHIFYTSWDIAAVAAFYFIKRVELANLIRISECIRYGEHGDSIRQKLMAVTRAPAGAV